MLSDGSLLGIGKDMENVTSHEDFEKEQQSLCENLLEQKQEQTEHDFIMMDDDEPDPTFDETELMDVSINRSGNAHIQHTGVDKPNHQCQINQVYESTKEDAQMKSNQHVHVFHLFVVYLLKLPVKLFKLFAKNCTTTTFTFQQMNKLWLKESKCNQPYMTTICMLFRQSRR